MKGIRRQGKLGRCSSQSGATAVEFAFIFPILLAVCYGAVVYAYAYVLQQAVNFAAQQGAQAAVAVVPGSTATTQSAAATNAINNTLSWLPTSQKGRISIPSNASDCSVPAGTFAVEVKFAIGGGTPLFPTLVNLPMVGTIPYLPDNLFACAVAYQ